MVINFIGVVIIRGGFMKRYSFTISIVSLFAFFTFLLSIFLIANFYTRGLSQAYELVNNKNSEAVKTIADSITSSVDSVTMHLKVLANITTSNNIIQSEDIVTKVMWEQLLSDSNMASIFLADEYGNFLQARRLPEYAIRVINTQDGKKLDIWDYKDLEFNTLRVEEKPLSYDPRVRPWYENVNQNMQMYWSDPYIFASTGQPGITVSLSVTDSNKNKLRVAAVDFTLDTLSNLLKEKGKTIDGSMIMFDDKGHIIASSFEYDTNEKDKISLVSSLKDKKYETIYKLAIEKDEQIGEIVSNNITYIYILYQNFQVHQIKSGMLHRLYKKV